MTNFYKLLKEAAEKKKAAVTDKEDDGEGMDPVGAEDGDVDNDGDSDESDAYLKKRRKAIGNAMKEESDDDGWYAHREMHGSKGISKEDWKKGWRMNSKGQKVRMKKEEVEQVDEVLDTVGKKLAYAAKGTLSSMVGDKDTKEKRVRGAKLLAKKAERQKQDNETKAYYNKVAGKTLRSMGQKTGYGSLYNKIYKEEVEQVDELKKSTLGSYIKKASGDMAGKTAAQVALVSSSKGKGDPDLKRGLVNRMKGISRATDKLAKEETELDEGLPPHLAKLVDKDGNFKDPKKREIWNRMLEKEKAKMKSKSVDVTPKGYGPVGESFSDSQIAQLKKAYGSLAGKKISIEHADRLRKIFDKIGTDTDALEKLYKADIPFVSLMASARLISKHKYKASDLSALKNEEFELDEKLDGHIVRGDTYAGVPDRVVAQAKERVKRMNPSTASEHQKAMNKALSDMGWEMTAGGKYVREEVELDEAKKTKDFVMPSSDEIAKMTDKEVAALRWRKQTHDQQKRKKDNKQMDEASIKPLSAQNDETRARLKGADEDNSRHIVMQLRKAVSLRGATPIKFADGKSAKIDPDVAARFIKKYNNLSKPADKEKLQAMAGKSYDAFKKALSEDFQLDELSQDTLRSYHAKAATDLKNKREKLNRGTLSSAELKKGQNRFKGLNRAADKMHEEEQIDELNKKAISAVRNRAAGRMMDSDLKDATATKVEKMASDRLNKIKKQEDEDRSKKEFKAWKEESEQDDLISSVVATISSKKFKY